MKKAIKVLLAMMLAVLMLASNVSAYAAAAPKAETEVMEMNWEDYAPEVEKAKLEGDFYALNQVALQFWVTSVLQQVEVTDEDAEDGLLAMFADEEGDYGFFVTYFDGEGSTLEEYAKLIEEDGAYDEVEFMKINGLDALTFSETDEDCEYGYIAFLTDAGYILTFTYWDISDEDYLGMVSIMVASIQPEETEAA